MTVHVTLKLATSLDGRIALSDGTSQWITGTESRARVHQMRAQSDAVITGIGTVLADDPMLTARTVPLPKTQPARIICDSHGRLPPAGRLAKSAGLGRVIVATAGGTHAALNAGGVESWDCGGHGHSGQVNLKQMLRRCEVEGLTKLMVECGGTLAAAFLRAGLVSTLHWFRAPILIGGDGLPALGPLGLTEMGDATRWRHAATERIGDDVLDTYVQT